MTSRTHSQPSVAGLHNPLWPGRPAADKATADGPAASPLDPGEREERADRLGHHLERFSAARGDSPTMSGGPASAGLAYHSPVQRVPVTRSQTRAAKAVTAAKKTVKKVVAKTPVTPAPRKLPKAPARVASLKSNKADVRLTRWARRAAARKAKGRFPVGRYDTDAGPVGISFGRHQQLMTRTRKGDFDDNSFGSVPPYADIKKAMPPGGLKALYSRVPKTATKKWTPRQKLATTLAVGLQHASENDRAPGLGKVVRALARRREAEPAAPHPLDTSVNPAVSTAQEARDLMSGTTKLNADQRMAIDDYASGSSDDDDDDQPIRLNMFRPRND
jgi:hypothetical protein